MPSGASSCAARKSARLYDPARRLQAIRSTRTGEELVAGSADVIPMMQGPPAKRGTYRQRTQPLTVGAANEPIYGGVVAARSSAVTAMSIGRLRSAHNG